MDVPSEPNPVLIRLFIGLARLFGLALAIFGGFLLFGTLQGWSNPDFTIDVDGVATGGRTAKILLLALSGGVCAVGLGLVSIGADNSPLAKRLFGWSNYLGQDGHRPNNSFQADPDPRERGSGPLNSNR